MTSVTSINILYPQVSLISGQTHVAELVCRRASLTFDFHLLWAHPINIG
jgi:hypothetical protein